MSKNRFLLPTVLLFTLLLSAISPVTSRTSAAGPLDRDLPVHPYLQVGAQKEPNRVARVIVQKTNGGVSSATLARAVGASVREEFPAINTFIIEIPQGLVLSLARQTGVRYVSFDAPVRKVGGIDEKDLTNLETTHQRAIGVHQVWASPTAATGNGVTVAIIDTGLNDQHADLGSNKTCVVINSNNNDCFDDHGHGTHVAGIIKGWEGDRRYLGIAPHAKLVSVKVANQGGAVTEADLLRGLQWIADNHQAQKIRVVNISLSMSLPSSYVSSPITAAVEHLWFKGVIVVASSGNRGGAPGATWHAPGNDPFIITVGALDHNATVETADDSLAHFSSRGKTQDGYDKPEIVAPGRKIVAPLAGRNTTLAQQFPDRVIQGDDVDGNEDHIRLSGTSMSAPVVTGLIALLLEKYPQLTPNQVKYLLMQTANAYPGKVDSAGVVDIAEALQWAASGRLGMANGGLTPARNASPTSSSGQPNNAYWDNAYWDGSAVEVFAGD